MMETEWYVTPVPVAAPPAAAAPATSPDSAAAAAAAAAGAAGLAVAAAAAAGAAAAAADDKRGRRRSWHIKMERKRRKGVFGSGGQLGPSPADAPRLLAAADRHKRPSWWNIFVPDHWPHRSRRASQDLPRSSDGTALPWQRSKSRSVDHGFSAPFDLDSLRSKVEGRFESVDRLSRGDSDGSVGSKDGQTERKPLPKAAIPVATTTYTVQANDTLTSVAARFDTTPSELAELNRLATRLVFPGQVLQVPLKAGAGADVTADGEGAAAATAPAPATGDVAASAAATAVAAAPAVSAIGAASGDETPDVSAASEEREGTPLVKPGISTEPPPSSECRFLKINVRHITDGQGVVGGVLLVTPNAVMFDPNVSDPLVIEHGPESYGVIAPMEYVANAAIYHDIAHMRVSSADRADRTSATVQGRPEVYHPRGAGPRSPGKDSLLVKDETFPELQAAEAAGDDDDDDGDDAANLSAGSSRDGDAFPKAFERELVTPTPTYGKTGEGEDGDGEGSSSRQVSLDSSTSAPSPAPQWEERRRSTLDHHWPVPSSGKAMSSGSSSVPASAGEEDPQDFAPVLAPALEKLTCHDSGIDIRDASLADAAHSTPASGDQGDRQPSTEEQEEQEIILPTKKVFSDADIILAPKTEWVPPVTTYNTVSSNYGTPSHSALDPPGSADGSRKKTSSVSFSLESNPESEGRESEDAHKFDDCEKQESRKNKMLKRLSYPVSWLEGLAGDKESEKEGIPGNIPTHHAAEAPAGDIQHHSSVFSKVFSRRSSVGTFIRQPTHQERPTHSKTPAPRLDYRSMVSVEDMPELFVSFDKLIPRPARSCEDPPLYLRLRMGKPINKKIPKSTPIMSYGKKKMRPEYWFSVPRNRVDELYNFLMAWVPHLYGDLDEIDPKSRGYELVESDTELWEDESGGSDPTRAERSGTASEGEDFGDITRESWEVLSMSEELRRALYASPGGSLDLESYIPDLVGTTEVLTEDHRRQLCTKLPARAEGYLWTLVFSTSQHGFSLNSMYRKMIRVESPILMVIQDTEQNVFGALTSCALKVSDHFYGTGESLLFRFTPDLQVFQWTGDNMYFIKGNNESLAIGAGDGKFGLWLDGDLYQGRTQSCSTYGNEPLVPQEDFVVKTLECWAFM